MQKTDITAGEAEPTAACLLIVDDNAQASPSLVTLFQRGGFIAGSVRSGRSAMEFLLKQSVDIVITDILVPNGDGLELLRELFDQNFRPRIVALTGGEVSSMSDLMHAASLIDAEHAIHKAFEPGKLLELVQGMLGTSTSFNLGLAEGGPV